MDRIAKVLLECFEAIARADALAVNDAAFRNQYRIIANAPGVLHALARARDAPEAPKTTRKRAAKPGQTSE